MIIRARQHIEGGFGPAVKTVEDEWRVTLDVLEIGLIGSYAKIDRKEAEAIAKDLMAEKETRLP